MMKNKYLLAFMLLLSAGVSAQELTITYTGTYNTQSPTLFAESGLNEEMRSSLASAYKDVVFSSQLVYKDGESEFRMLPFGEDQKVVFMGQTLNLSSNNESLKQNYQYKNHGEGLVLEKTSVFGKNFIVSDTIQSRPYTIYKNEVKEILGFECIKAVSEDGKTTVWFTSHIPIPNEPYVCGLDGLILEYYGDKIISIASDIQNKVDNEVVRHEGKIMSKKDFDEMVKKRVDMLKRH